MSMKKILMYNGGKDSYYGCDDPEVLTKGTLYEIVAEEDVRGFQTNYTLKGIDGKFNSVWFDEPNTYFAYTDTIPVEGELMKKIIRFEGTDITSIKHTSMVHYVEPITSDVYKVYTQNTLYVVKVLNEEES